MPVSRSSLVVNHRVALSGTPMRAAAGRYGLEYIDSRPGAVRAEDMDRQRQILLDADERERNQALLDYIDGRPGAARGDGGSLFGQLGDTSLAEAKAEIAKAKGSISRTVISVRREDAEALGLDTREGWERYLRANWQQEFARMTGTPEHRVRWVGAVHVNHEKSIHVHVFSWDAGQRDPWDALFDKRLMEASRRRLTDAALTPEFDRLKRVRTLARDAAVEAVRNTDLTEVAPSVGLPKDGSLKYAHLNRYHPVVAARVDAVAHQAVATSADATAAVAAHRDAVRRMAELKGLEGSLLDEYETKAEEDLTKRLRNATISALVPNRRARPAHERRLATDTSDLDRAAATPIVANDRDEATLTNTPAATDRGHDTNARAAATVAPAITATDGRDEAPRSVSPETAGHGTPELVETGHAVEGEFVPYEELGWDLTGSARRLDDPAWAMALEPEPEVTTIDAPTEGGHALGTDDALRRLSLDPNDPRLARAFALWEEHVANAEAIKLANDHGAWRILTTAEPHVDLDLALRHPALLPLVGPEDEARRAIRQSLRDSAVTTARERLADALDDSVSPSRLRRRARAVTEEIRSTLGRAKTDHDGNIDVEAELRRCPSVARAAAKGAVDTAKLATELMASGGDGHDTGTDAARALLTSPAIPRIAERVARALEGVSADIDARIDRFAERAQRAETAREVMDIDVGMDR